MTISSETRKAGPFTGNGITATFPFTFKVFQASDLKVVRADLTGAETILVQGTDYTVSLNANQDSNPGGSIVLPAALTSGFLLAATSKVPNTQPMDLTNQGGFYPKVINNAMDRLEVQIQQVALDAASAVRVPLTSSVSVEELTADLIRLGDSADNIDTVAGNIGAVNTNATNIVAIQGASANAISAAASAAASAASYNSFRGIYYGAASSDPTVDPLGNAPTAGDLYFNSTTQKLRVYGGTTWQEGNAGSIGVQQFSGTGAQTAFSLSAAPASENNTQVYISGVYQQKDRYDVSGTTLTFVVAPPSGTNNIEVVTINTLPLGTTDASLVNFAPAGAGAVARTAQEKLREAVSVKDFGADNTGATNATASLLNFFNYCIDTGTPGHIPAGTYLVTAGVLAFDNGFTNKLWPNISTDGYGAVTFKRADATDAPFISITNGTATSGVDRTWKGGSLGGITFDQNGKTTGTSQHGLLLRGLVGTKFGYMRANDQGGSCIFIEQKLYGGSNPDPYNVASCYFDGAEANRCGGASFYNDNYVGLAACTINYVRAIETVTGAFFGYGAGNRINAMSVGSCSGWALGNQTNNTGGSSTRFSLGIAEFDDVQYGIDMRRVSNSDFGTVRFVHRHNFGPLNPAGGYWPRIAVQCSSAVPVIQNNLKIIDRIETGGLKANLGQFFDFGSAGGQLADLYVRRQTIDNAGFGFVLSDYYTNFNSNTKVLYTDLQGLPIIDTLKKTALIARAPTTFAVPSGGFTGGSNTVQYGTELSDFSDSYNPATWTYTCRGPGQYRVVARIVLAVAVGTRIRIAIMQNGSAVSARYFYATTASAQCYEISGEFDVSAGATFNINADQNTGGAVNLTTNLSSNENSFFITQI